MNYVSITLRLPEIPQWLMWNEIRGSTLKKWAFKPLNFSQNTIKLQVESSDCLFK